MVSYHLHKYSTDSSEEEDIKAIVNIFERDNIHMPDEESLPLNLITAAKDGDTDNVIKLLHTIPNFGTRSEVGWVVFGTASAYQNFDTAGAIIKYMNQAYVPGSIQRSTESKKQDDNTSELLRH